VKGSSLCRWSVRLFVHSQPNSFLVKASKLSSLYLYSFINQNNFRFVLLSVSRHCVCESRAEELGFSDSLNESAQRDGARCENLLEKAMHHSVLDLMGLQDSNGT
jgi:hypothetical protein